MSDENAKATMPHQALIVSLLSPLTPKTEREHAAVREIKQLRDELRECREENERLERRMSDSTSDEYRDRRERIATAALQGLLAAPITPRDGTAKGFANLAIEFTDALIAELDKEPTALAAEPTVKESLTVEALRRENERLREALQDIARQREGDEDSAQAVAKAALRREESSG